MSEKPTKTQDEASAKTPTAPAPFVEKYYRVRFHEKSNEQQQDNVELSVNGDTLVIQRGVEVVIPGRFRECADNAVYPQFRQMPGKVRKTIGSVRIFPYDFIREATKEEYLSMRQTGTKAMREAAAKDEATQ